MTKSYLTVDDISEKLDVCKETVRRWIRSGRLKATIHSRRDGSVISEEEYNKFLEENPKYKPKTIDELYEITEKNISEIKRLCDETDKIMKELEVIQKKLKSVSDIKRRMTIIEKKLKEVER